MRTKTRTGLQSSTPSNFARPKHGSLPKYFCLAWEERMRNIVDTRACSARSLTTWQPTGLGYTAAHLRSLEPLPYIQVGAGLIDHVHVRLLRCHHRNGKALQLAACSPPRILPEHRNTNVSCHELV